MTLVAGTLLAAAIGALTVATASITTACSSQETTPAPDVVRPPCNRGPFIFCDPVAAEVPSCSTDDGASPLLSRLPRATRYPVGCVIDYVGERDEQGDCELEAVCKCLIAEATGTPTPPPDAGEDLDAAPEDAAPPPPPPPPVPAGPAWNCYP
jgi:hypothetical protein